MSRLQKIGRFKANPVEIAILLVMTIITTNSFYNLFYEHQEFRMAALSPMYLNPISEGRTPASNLINFMTLEIPCDEPPHSTTSASKIRLAGKFCSIEMPSEGKNKTLMKASILNTSNQFLATVFSDLKEGKFSTDYIPLKPGLNSLHIEFHFSSEKVFIRDLQITRN